MCLIVNNFYHRVHEETVAPFCADNPIVVLKVLKKRKLFSRWTTPYLEMLIHFKRRKCILDKIPIDEFSKTKKYYSTSLMMKDEDSYHAFIDINRAVCHKERLKNAAIFKAIIPVGSYYYIGDSGDICSDQLIITKHKVRM